MHRPLDKGPTLQCRAERKGGGGEPLGGVGSGVTEGAGSRPHRHAPVGPRLLEPRRRHRAVGETSRRKGQTSCSLNTEGTPGS